jgi:ABC-2 type transport system permease protein
MNLRNIKAITKKETLHIIRDPRSLIMGLIIPVLMLFLFGYALDMDVNNIPVGIIDHDKSDLSRDFISRLQGSEYFEIKFFSENFEMLEQLVIKGQLTGILTIPENFSSEINNKKYAKLQFVIDGSDSNTASIALSYIEALTFEWQNKLLNQAKPFVEIIPRVWFNEEMKSRNYIVPGLIAVIMMIIAALLTSLTIAREYETGTLEGLIPSPVTESEIIAGKIIPYFVMGIIDLFICVGTSYFIFNVPFRGNFLLLLFSSSLFLFGGLGFGILLSVIAKSQLVASQLALVTTFLPAFLLSGFIFDIYNMPLPVQTISRVVSARYFVTLIKAIILKGNGLGFIITELSFLTIYMVIIIGLARLKFKKEI